VAAVAKIDWMAKTMMISSMVVLEKINSTAANMMTFCKVVRAKI
jgi:hypothetical protein